jgi:hypothetical protein
MKWFKIPEKYVNHTYNIKVKFNFKTKKVEKAK